MYTENGRHRLRQHEGVQLCVHCGKTAGKEIIIYLLYICCCLYSEFICYCFLTPDESCFVNAISFYNRLLKVSFPIGLLYQQSFSLFISLLDFLHHRTRNGDNACRQFLPVVIKKNIYYVSLTKIIKAKMLSELKCLRSKSTVS